MYIQLINRGVRGCGALIQRAEVQQRVWREHASGLGLGPPLAARRELLENWSADFPASLGS